MYPTSGCPGSVKRSTPPRAKRALGPLSFSRPVRPYWPMTSTNTSAEAPATVLCSPVATSTTYCTPVVTGASGRRVRRSEPSSRPAAIQRWQGKLTSCPAVSLVTLTCSTNQPPMGESCPTSMCVMSARSTPARSWNLSAPGSKRPPGGASASGPVSRLLVLLIMLMNASEMLPAPSSSPVTTSTVYAPPLPGVRFGCLASSRISGSFRVVPCLESSHLSAMACAFSPVVRLCTCTSARCQPAPRPAPSCPISRALRCPVSGRALMVNTSSWLRSKRFLLPYAVCLAVSFTGPASAFSPISLTCTLASVPAPLTSLVLISSL
mmetsp:Transcript_23205/g.59465  ORF Transcript_23205/g.59465 Transcript_23205/m.59465 type:complete len:322 (-) Transcript_23205:660-1625(-)